MIFRGALKNISSVLDVAFLQKYFKVLASHHLPPIYFSKKDLPSIFLSAVHIYATISNFLYFLYLTLSTQANLSYLSLLNRAKHLTAHMNKIINIFKRNPNVPCAKTKKKNLKWFHQYNILKAWIKVTFTNFVRIQNCC